jgi:hypothetical protein
MVIPRLRNFRDLNRETVAALTRRAVLAGLGAPAIVRLSTLMPIRGRRADLCRICRAAAL